MKKWIIVFLFLTLQLNAISQNVPIIETEIGAKYSFTQQELTEDTELRILYGKYSDLVWGTEEDKKKIPSADRARLESLIERRGADWEYMMWSTEPIGCSWYCGGYHFQTVSSSLPNTIKNCYDESSIFDRDVRTAWVEGAKGYGIGEYVEVHFPQIFAQATMCYIVNGYNKDERTWKNNSRVKTMNLYIDDKLVGIVNLKDTRDEQCFILPDTIPNLSDTTNFKMMEFEGQTYKVSTLKFLITDVYKGDKYDDTAISELSFDGIGVHCLAEGTAVTVSSDSIKKIEEIKIGDSLLTYDTDKGEYITSRVKKVHSVIHKELYKITLSNGESIVATDDHPFYSSKGWLSINPAKTKQYKRYSNCSVKQLEVDSELQGRASIRVVDISTIIEPVKTYTLEFENENVAFIANGLLVGQE